MRSEDVAELFSISKNATNSLEEIMDDAISGKCSPAEAAKKARQIMKETKGMREKLTFRTGGRGWSGIR